MCYNGPPHQISGHFVPLRPWACAVDSFEGSRESLELKRRPPWLRSCREASFLRHACTTFMDRFFDTASGGECLLSCESVTSRWPLTRSRPHGMSDWKGETDGKRRFSPGLRFARWKTLREGNLVWKCFLRGASSPCVCRLLIAPDFQVPANKQLREESCIQHLFGA